MKSKELLNDFTKYCQEHPEERFWQALRNWSGADFLMYWDNKEFDEKEADRMGLKDTFYWEGKNE